MKRKPSLNMRRRVSYYEANLIKEENLGGTIFIGDSYFDGYPIESKGNKPSFWNDFYEDFAGEKAFLMGISQSQIDELEMDSERLVYPMQPKEIVIHIGFNDIHHSPYSVNHLYSRITALIDRFKERLPDTEIYFMGVEPKKNGYTEGTDFYYSSTVKAKQLTEKMVDFCAVSDRVTYLDTMSIFVNDSGTIKTDAYLSTDLSHPTLASYDKIREALLAARAYKDE